MNYRKYLTLLDNIILFYLIVILFLSPGFFWYHGVIIYAIFTILEISIYTYERRKLINKKRIYLIETKSQVLSVDYIIVNSLIIIFLFLVITHWAILSLHKNLILQFSIITGLKYSLFTKQKRSIVLDHVKIRFGELFVSDIGYDEIENISLNDKDNCLMIKLLNQKTIKVKINEEFYLDHITEIKSLVKKISIKT